MFKKEKKINKEKGVVLLFAVLVSVLLLSIALSISSIALRQTVLSSTGRESQVAFYVANTALECAHYWDLNPPGDGAEGYVFPNTDPFLDEDSYFGTDPVTCAGSTINPGNMDFELMITNSKTGDVYCSKVKVSKEANTSDNPAEGQYRTTIQARGYNQSTCDLGSPRVVERGLELSYTS